MKKVRLILMVTDFEFPGTNYQVRSTNHMFDATTFIKGSVM